MPTPDTTPSTASACGTLLQAVRRDIGAFTQRARVLIRPAGETTIPDVVSAPLTRSWYWGTAKMFVVLTLVATVVSMTAMLLVLRDLPLDGGIPAGGDQSILLEAADGQPLGHVGPLKVSNAARAEFPPTLVSAVLSVEDRRFYQHWGIDPIGIARAATRNYGLGRIAEGGSTITQQFVKLRLVGNERTFARKLREALTALWLEMRLGKEEILTRYLNSVYMGAGAQGIPAAAELYFDKTPSELTLPEAALLAGMIKAPTRYNPLHNLAGARARAAVVLGAMVDAGAIDTQVAEAAKAHPATLNPPAVESEGPTWFSDWVSPEARDVTAGLRGTLRVRTTLVPELQKVANEVVSDGLRNSAPLNVSQAALVAMRPDGSVVAMVGGRNYSESQFNRAAQAQRQPGSAFKPFVFLAALRSGWRPTDVVDASPLQIGAWEPKNYDGRDYGGVTLENGFAHSINTAAVRLAIDVGLDQVILAARDLGISTPLPEVPSIALGSAEVSLLNLTAAYASILAGHAPIQPWGVASLASEEQPRLMSIGAPAAKQTDLGVPGTQLRDLLRLPVERGTARAAALEGYAAGKTGTTQDHRDAWFIGFTQSLVVGIWVGNDDRTPMDEVTGGSLPAVMWKNFMLKAAPVPSVAADPQTVAQGTTPALGDGAGGQCDFRACANRYQSFAAADCSYQPFGGGSRQRCALTEEGTAAKPTTPRAVAIEDPVQRRAPPSSQPSPRPSRVVVAREPRAEFLGPAELRPAGKSAEDFNGRNSDDTGTRDYRSLRERLLQF